MLNIVIGNSAFSCTIHSSHRCQDRPIILVHSNTQAIMVVDRRAADPQYTNLRIHTYLLQNVYTTDVTHHTSLYSFLKGGSYRLPNHPPLPRLSWNPPSRTLPVFSFASPCCRRMKCKKKSTIFFLLGLEFVISRRISGKARFVSTYAACYYARQTRKLEHGTYLLLIQRPTIYYRCQSPKSSKQLPPCNRWAHHCYAITVSAYYIIASTGAELSSRDPLLKTEMLKRIPQTNARRICCFVGSKQKAGSQCCVCFQHSYGPRLTLLLVRVVGYYGSDSAKRRQLSKDALERWVMGWRVLFPNGFWPR